MKVVSEIYINNEAFKIDGGMLMNVNLRALLYIHQILYIMFL